MSRVLIIGAGGVGGVVTHKCAQARETFSEVLLASRTESKCEAIARDVKKLQPERSIRMIHRFHQTNLGNILSAWKDYPDTFDLSYKYSVAHMYSSPAPPAPPSKLANSA